jgi:hypothetical protein
MLKTVPALMILVGTSEDASALEERNEMLCGTGFFTNIAQYKCTDIGDIGGEGKVKKMSEKELGSMESLLGKMGVEGALVDDEKKESVLKPREKSKGESAKRQ